MKLNTSIYDGTVPLNGDIGLNYTATNTVENLISLGRLQLNVPIDESIFYTVDFNPLDDYFGRCSKNYDKRKKSWNFVNGTQKPAGIAMMCTSNFFGPNSDNFPQNKAIGIHGIAWAQRMAYDTTGITSLVRFLTEWTPTNIVFLVMCVAYKLTYNGEGDVTAYSDRVEVDIDTYQKNYAGTHKIISLFVIPYMSNTENPPRRAMYGIYPIMFCTYNPSDITDDKNFQLYGTLFQEYYPQSHGVLSRFIFGADSLDTEYFNTYSEVYANLGKIELWDDPTFAIGSDVYTGALPVFKYSLDNIHQLYSHMGLFYTFSENTAKNGALTDDDVFCGNIDDDGKVTGKITSGEKNNDTPQIKWNTPTAWQGNNYNGIANTDPNTYTDKIDLNKPTLSTINTFNRTYAINGNTVKNLADFLWNADETKFDEIIKGLGLMGQNPIDGLIDLRLYPFNVATKNSATAAEDIVVGRTNTGVKGIKLTENVSGLIDLGSCTFFQKFKNFLDYEPYTTAQLYIPYVGVVPVSTAEFMGRNVSCKMIVDYTTGACTAVVFRDDIPYIYRNGSLAVEVPMTATNSARTAQTTLNNVIGTAMNVGSTVGSLATGNIGGAVSSAVGAISGVYDIMAQPTQYQTAGASTANCATWQPQQCYFIITRPIPIVPDNYGHTVGYACEQSGQLGNFSGFTMVANPVIDFKCTDTEKTMIIQQLQNGVYI